MAGALGAFAQVAGGIGDTVINHYFANRMMEYQNDYNSPKNQAARLRAAGLSSWSINPQGNTSAQPILGNSDIGTNVGSAVSNSIADRQLDIQSKQADAAIERERAQADVQKTMAETNRVLLKYLDESEKLRLKGSEISNEYLSKQSKYYDETVRQNIATQKSVEALNYVNSGKAMADTKRVERLLSYEERKLFSEINLNYQTITNLKENAKLTIQQVKNLIQDINKSKEEVKKIGAETWLAKYKNRMLEKLGVTPGSSPWAAASDVVTSAIYRFSEEMKALHGNK